MPDQMSIGEQLLYSTVKIQTIGPYGVGIGTGFIYDCLMDNNKSSYVVVTNKHVVRNAVRGRFQFHVSKNGIPSGQQMMFELENFESRWIMHPDAEVDLCIMSFPSVANGVPLFFRCLNGSLIYDDDKLKTLLAIEDVLLIGYPIGLGDDFNNMPIVRRGITASHPALNFQGKCWGVIDAACFPGSSGSPVLIVNEGSFLTKDAMNVGSSRIVFLGVLFGGPQFTEKGDIIIEDIPMVQKPQASINLSIHLGYYVKAKELLVLAKQIESEINVRDA